MGVLSREIRSVCPEEQLYLDDFFSFVSLTLEGMEGKLETWKGALKSKGLTVNVKKKEILIISEKGFLSQYKASQKKYNPVKVIKEKTYFLVRL